VRCGHWRGDELILKQCLLSIEALIDEDHMTWPLSDRRERTFESEGHTLLLTRTPTSVKQARTAEVDDRSRDQGIQTTNTEEASRGADAGQSNKAGVGPRVRVQINRVRRLRIAHPQILLA
jgi:hypothetical protein